MGPLGRGRTARQFLGPKLVKLTGIIGVRYIIVRFVVFLTAALSVLAADIAVRRDGPSFRISGAASSAGVQLFVGDGDVPPVLGTFFNDGADILFRPRFEVSKFVASRLVVNGKVFHFPAEKQIQERTTFVEHVYPTASGIPANQLKFYVQFSAPMLRGEAWDHLQLLDAQGKVIDLAFLEIDQELWDRDNRRLTVLFDPGRIKRGVLPRDQAGAALEEGKSYTLVASPNWRDDRRVPLKQEFRKSFKVIAEDRTAIDPAKWTVSSPKTASREPLIIDFSESLDAALALRLIKIGIPGQTVLAAAERGLQFVPDQPWPASPVAIEIDTALEDLAGNKVGRPFDVDTFDPITVRSGRGIVRLKIVPKP